ncbi:MAG: hypothetical protein CVU17_02360 [Betaproteobacteria bacterium HGW-Betaproteobacteria-11]|nr:MAG: hypothetical protein CVU17_02360 [Betaproteobacteria bacterium HGW-Betaproteobacteria-11]
MKIIACILCGSGEMLLVALERGIDAIGFDTNRPRPDFYFRANRRLGSKNNEALHYDDGYRAIARAAGFSHFYTVGRGTCLPRTSMEEIPRIVVVKDKAGLWFGSRLRLYHQPRLTAIYDRIH